MNRKEFKALAKSIKFPGGADVHFSEAGEKFSLEWHKRGGHAGGKKVSQVAKAAVDAGFIPAKQNNGNSPDGSVVTSGSEYVLLKDDKVVAKLYVSERYGVTAYENSYTIRLWTIGT